MTNAIFICRPGLSLIYQCIQYSSVKKYVITYVFTCFILLQLYQLQNLVHLLKWVAHQVKTVATTPINIVLSIRRL